MASHPLRKYIRYVQNSVIKAGLPRPNYGWSMAWVQQFYTQAKSEATSIPDLKRRLADTIVPIAKLMHDVEGRYLRPRTKPKP